MSQGTARSRSVRRRPARADAFTLIEMLVTITLLVIIVYMLAVTFRAASVAFNQTRITVEAHQTARAVMDMLHDDLVGARLTRPGAGQDLLFECADGAGNDQLNFTTTAFQSARSDPAAPLPTLAQIVEVRYYLDGDRLMKRVDWDGDPSSDNADDAETMGFNVKAVDFRLFDRGGSGRPGWTSDGDWPRTFGRLPAAVEVTLVVETTDNRGDKKDHTLSQVIYLPNSETQGG